ncbi:MAG: hypothetical protein WEG40_08110 [Candidatus Rokuibacteriota bacterium]
MTPSGSAALLSKDALRALAQAQGLALSEVDLEGLLPLVQSGRTVLAELAGAPIDDVEPTSLYHML